MDYLPILIKIKDKKVLLIGGGKAALQKVGVLQQYTNNLTVLSLTFCPELLKNGQITRIQKSYEAEDIKGFDIVYACTDIQELNEQIYADAHHWGALINTVDNTPLCDFVSPAIYKRENMTVAIGSDGKEVLSSIALRDKIAAYLDTERE